MASGTERITLSQHITIIVGLFFILGGLAFRGGTSGETRLRCEVEAGGCTLETSRFLRSTSQHIPLEAIHRASVKGWRSANDSMRYVAILATQEGSFELSHYASSSRSSHERLASEANRYFNAPYGRPLDLRHRMGWGWSLFFWMFVVSGIALIVALRNVADVVIEPSSRRLRLERRRFWQRTGIGRTIDLDEIEGLEIETARADGNRLTHRIVIRLVSGGKVPVFDFFITGRGSAVRRRDRLRAFLRDHNVEPGEPPGAHDLAP